MLKYLKLFFISLLFFSCSSTKHLVKEEEQNLTSLIKSNETFIQHFTGFVLSDLQTGQELFNQHGDKYFTPASNTKIFTLYASLKNIPTDSIPSFDYTIKNDSVFIKPYGDPSLLHDAFSKNTSQRLKHLFGQRKVIINRAVYKDQKYGSGWAWDDYLYSYQVEKSLMPLFANRVHISHSDSETIVRPNYFTNDVLLVDELHFKARRDEYENVFYIRSKDRAQNIPFVTSDALLAALLEDEFEAEVSYAEKDLYDYDKTFYANDKHSILQKFMVDSDNQIAEQLLHVCAMNILGYQSVPDVIDSLKSTLFVDAPQELLWVDGSGLSRYNMFTPNTIIYLLNQIYQDFGIEAVENYFAVGGYSGTIKNYYAGDDEPYVFAKTGSLRSNHTLSGYLKANSGKIYLFSFMHNHFKGSSKPVKLEMEKVLAYIKNHY